MRDSQRLHSPYQVCLPPPFRRRRRLPSSDSSVDIVLALPLPLPLSLFFSPLQFSCGGNLRELLYKKNVSEGYQVHMSTFSLGFLAPVRIPFRPSSLPLVSSRFSNDLYALNTHRRLLALSSFWLTPHK